MAERVIAELDGKVDAFLVPGEGAASERGVRVEVKRVNAAFAGPAEDAVLALMALGQTRGEAEEGVGKAMARAEKSGRVLSSPDKIVEAVFGG
jgi:Holliday junction resolvasome RuvABC DNA-binding subunit